MSILKKVIFILFIQRKIKRQIRNVLNCKICTFKGVNFFSYIFYEILSKFKKDTSLHLVFNNSYPLKPTMPTYYSINSLTDLRNKALVYISEDDDFIKEIDATISKCKEDNKEQEAAYEKRKADYESPEWRIFHESMLGLKRHISAYSSRAETKYGSYDPAQK